MRINLNIFSLNIQLFLNRLDQYTKAINITGSQYLILVTKYIIQSLIPFSLISLIKAGIQRASDLSYFVLCHKEDLRSVHVKKKKSSYFISCCQGQSRLTSEVIGKHFAPGWGFDGAFIDYEDNWSMLSPRHLFKCLFT